MRGGAKSKYDPAVTPAKCRELLAERKLTNKELAKALGISERLLYEWQAAHPELRMAVLEGKSVANEAIEGAVFKNAFGYDYDEETWERLPVKKLNPETGLMEVVGHELVLTKKVTKHNPGTSTDRVFWLKNRAPGRWKDSQEHNHSGPNGGPIRIQNEEADLSHYTTEELEAMRKIHEAANARVDQQGTGGA